jgi:hypothetical protein
VEFLTSFLFYNKRIRSCDCASDQAAKREHSYTVRLSGAMYVDWNALSLDQFCKSYLFFGTSYLLKKGTIVTYKGYA